MKLQEIEKASSHLKECPKCRFSEGFWFAVRGSHLFAQCKSCGVEVELCEVHRFAEVNKKYWWLRVFGK